MAGPLPFASVTSSTHFGAERSGPAGPILLPAAGTKAHKGSEEGELRGHMRPKATIAGEQFHAVIFHMECVVTQTAKDHAAAG